MEFKKVCPGLEDCRRKAEEASREVQTEPPGGRKRFARVDGCRSRVGRDFGRADSMFQSTGWGRA